MKSILSNIKLLSIFAVLALSTFSCKKDVPKYLFEGPNSVVFEGAGVSLVESDTFETYTAKVFLVAPLQTTDVTVALSISSINGVGVVGDDITLLTTSLTIPAGSLEGEVEYKIHENDAADGTKQFGIKIDGNSAGFKVGFGDGSEKSTFVITVDDNDCALDLDAFAATTYDATEDLYYNVFGDPGSGLVHFDPGITSNTDPSYPNSLLSTNLGDWGGDPAILTFSTDVANPTITIEPTFAFTTSGFDLYWSGFGTYVSCTHSIELTYILTFDDMVTPAFDPAEAYNHLTPQ